jgi:hypothetical protein
MACHHLILARNPRREVLLNRYTMDVGPGGIYAVQATDWDAPLELQTWLYLTAVRARMYPGDRACPPLVVLLSRGACLALHRTGPPL